MSRAYKCDGCKQHKDGRPDASLLVPQGWLDGGISMPSGEPLQTAELCDTCMTRLKRVFRALPPETDQLGRPI